MRVSIKSEGRGKGYIMCITKNEGKPAKHTAFNTCDLRHLEVPEHIEWRADTNGENWVPFSGAMHISNELIN